MATQKGSETNPFTKDPDAVRTVGLNWATRLLAGDTLGTSTWTRVSGTVVIESSTSTTITASVKLSGGTIGELNVLRNRVTTALGETEDWTIYVRIKQR